MEGLVPVTVNVSDTDSTTETFSGVREKLVSLRMLSPLMAPLLVLGLYTSTNKQ